MTLLELDDLKITYSAGENDIHAVNGVSFTFDAGDNYGLVGESGCGKSTIADAILGLLDDNATVERGTIRFDGQDLLDLSDAGWQDIRWERIAYIPQSAMDALDPVLSVGDQIIQAIQKHRDVPSQQARERVAEVFEIVSLDPARMDDYPHQFSGGMRQRVTIAMALVLDPDLIIADEPTTGLDVIVQDKIIDNLLDIQEEIDSSLLLITHDIGVVAETCDDVSVLYGGKVMEQGRTYDVFKSPTNPYTMGLKNAFPDIEDFDSAAVSIPGSLPELNEEPSGCVFQDRCPFSTEACADGHPPLVEAENQHSACYYADQAAELREKAAKPETWGHATDITSGERTFGDTVLETEGLSKWFKQSQALLDQLRGAEPEYVKAVQDVSINIHEGEILGIAGESGCGKSTLGEVISLLQSRTDGTVTFRGQSVDEYRDGNMKTFRSKVQFIFQDPFDSLNPRQTVRSIVSEPLKIQGEDSDNIEDRLIETLEDIGLTPPAKFLDQYPHQLSGGERQRVAIARSLILDPEVLICDEPASMLDVSLKADILNILRELANERGLGVIYISHDLASLTQITDRLAIMYLGRIIEVGETPDVVQNPRHPYAASLLAASPKANPAANRERVLLPGEPPDPIDLPDGCKFAPRCPKSREECRTEEPDIDTYAEGTHRAACFFPVENTDEEIAIEDNP